MIDQRRLSIKMSVDVFGRHLKERIQVGIPTSQKNGINFTPDGHYDFKNKRLCNVATPEDPNDAINLGTFATYALEVQKIHEVTQQLQSALNDLSKKIEQLLPNKA